MQAYREHAAQDDGRNLRHALPLLAVGRTVIIYVLQTEDDVQGRRITLHLAV